MNRLNEFITNLASSEPLPGGGSAGALTGALAAALGEMMAGLTEGRERFLPVQAQVREIHARMAGLREIFQSLVQEDSEAYRSLLKAIRLPKATAEEALARGDAIEKAARNATETPLRTARAAVEVLEYLETLIEIGNPNARSDAAVGAQLAYASLKAGQYNILANIKALRNRSFAESCHREVSDLLLKANKILQHIDRQVAGS